ncbi:FKBP-type peptidyl-prolyl cis-trans isomerase [Porphyromonas sp.]|uniref:FKBP-type peptidyl-prolyl cis-trans isomerase n=1 Tax=Porphyromonas sp. TaxID=1924944 RepID=UPI0026DC763E|nr:FKBP-type peptidyl-prolyl cis-trans isomerase [Porphyromonas sp.]MDO4695855.1 FKBP-type peptidyl-prolyl cis-trans isomerase [Porphyromonas sp.]MDO4770268.1 FKBP-type peptidyl-prolyl cis-trans isomerase [Porphyromonas sp.]
MKKIVFSSILGLVATAMVSCGGGVSSNVSIKTPIDTAAYAVGFANGQGLAASLKGFPGDSLDGKLIAAGLYDALVGNPGKMTVEDAQKFIQKYVEDIQVQIKNRNIEEEQTFLEKNKSAEGVITTESGLQYKYEVEGTGAKATSPKDTVVVHYKGTTLDDKQFDSSYDRGEPSTFPLDEVISGWTEAFQIFPVGSKITMWLPSALAYGERDLGEFGPNRLLRFECELLEVRPYKGK